LLIGEAGQFGREGFSVNFMGCVRHNA